MTDLNTYGTVDQLPERDEPTDQNHVAAYPMTNQGFFD